MRLQHCLQDWSHSLKILLLKNVGLIYFRPVGSENTQDVIILYSAQSWHRAVWSVTPETQILVQPRVVSRSRPLWVWLVFSGTGRHGDTAVAIRPVRPLPAAPVNPQSGFVSVAVMDPAALLNLPHGSFQSLSCLCKSFELIMMWAGGGGTLRLCKCCLFLSLELAAPDPYCLYTTAPMCQVWSCLSEH